MMQLAEQFALAEIFRQNAAAKRREVMAAQQAEQEFFEQRREERREKADREFREFVEHATQEQVESFNRTLDRYDTAVVDALMDNEKALDRARKDRDALLSEAEVLPDGRKVFKSNDGARVFDQNGLELDHETVDPAAISDAKPRWEEFKRQEDAHERLLHEREELLKCQKRLDDARETVGKGGATSRELDDLGADLKAAMPDAVRRRLGHERGDDLDQAASAPPSALAGPTGRKALAAEFGPR